MKSHSFDKFFNYSFTKRGFFPGTLTDSLYATIHMHNFSVYAYYMLQMYICTESKIDEGGNTVGWIVFLPAMVLILVGNSEIGGGISVSGICFRHLLRSRAVTNLIFFLRKNLCSELPSNISTMSLIINCRFIFLLFHAINQT